MTPVLDRLTGYVANMIGQITRKESEEVAPGNQSNMPAHRTDRYDRPSYNNTMGQSRDSRYPEHKSYHSSYYSDRTSQRDDGQRRPYSPPRRYFDRVKSTENYRSYRSRSPSPQRDYAPMTSVAPNENRRLYSSSVYSSRDKMSNLGNSLRQPDWSQAALSTFQKDFYVEHAQVKGRSEGEVAKFRE